MSKHKKQPPSDLTVSLGGLFFAFPQQIFLVAVHGELTLDKVVSSRKPFGLATTAKPMKTGDITLRYNGGRGPYKSTEIRVGTEMIDQWKIIISRLTAEHAGQPAKDGKYRVLSTMELLKPGEICSETYLVAGAFDSKEEATNYMDYLKTQFVRSTRNGVVFTLNP